MSFYRRVKYFMVHTLMLSNKAAQALIDAGCVELDGQAVADNCLMPDYSEIKINGKIVREKTQLVYLKFYKPPGFESTLSTVLAHSLSPFFKDYKGLAIAGRLDKQSEGLLLLSNDGKWVEHICNPKFEKEKEYMVILDKDAGELFINLFKNGVNIGGYITKPCGCRRIGPCLINVTLTEGKNRQIRRMCKALGFEVLKLQRIRMADIYLDDLKPGEINVIKI
jgi:23S rRNA pseudouridine2604 synthase